MGKLKKEIKMKGLIIFSFILCTIISCDKDVTIESQRKNSEICMKEAMAEADKWIKTLDEIGYQVLSDQIYPPPFDEIMSKSSRKEKIQKGITRMEQDFGKIKERKFFGVYILLDGKLLTYIPEKIESFKQISPEKLGVKKIGYKDNVKGTYAYLIYDSKPTKKEKAEECIAMWRDNNNKWWFVGYEIADEI